MAIDDHPVFGFRPGEPKPKFASVYTDGDDQAEAIGIHERIWQSNGASNAYLVTTAGGNVVVNTGLPHEGVRHRRLFAAVRDAPITHIVLTQGHFDHTGGVNLMKHEGTQVIASSAFEGLQDYQKRFVGFRMPRNLVFFAPLIQKSLEALANDPEMSERHPDLEVHPTVLVEDRHAFEEGGVRFECLAVPGGETTDSICLWLPDERVAFTGNQLGPLFPHFPNLITLRGDMLRSPLAYLESLERVRALEPELLVTGHHEPIRGAEAIQQHLRDLRDAVRHVHDATVEGMNAGKTVHELMREIRLPDHVDVGEGYGKVSWGVKAIWEHAQGWFHYDSTTSLYPVPASTVHPDVVELAGGPGPVAEVAARRLEADEPVEAIHLAEMALAADPHHRDALAVKLGAHERLLELSGGENFWEVIWLRHVAHQTREALAALV